MTAWGTAVLQRLTTINEQGVEKKNTPVKQTLKQLPGFNKVTRFIKPYIQRVAFPGSVHYWEKRYQHGGTSGAGSYGKLAQFKADFLNTFVEQQGIQSVIEFGCGDGHQLSLAHYPRYIGLDVSLTAIQMCQQRFGSDSSKSFFIYHPQGFVDNAQVLRADAALSLDVIYHLVEDPAFNTYMNHLFQSAARFVIIYSSNKEGRPRSHVRHRQFTHWIEQHQPAWSLREHKRNPYPIEHDPDGSFADFYVYQCV